MAEEVLLNTGEIRVTPARVIFGASTYAVANITSVKAVRESTRRRTGIIMLAITVLLILPLAVMQHVDAANAAVVSESTRNFTWGLDALVLAFIVTSILLIKFGVEFQVVFTTGAGEQTALTSRSQQYIFDAASAVNLAIMKRAALLDR